MSEKVTKKQEAAKLPRTVNIKRKLTEVSLGKIRIPAENPARVSCDATVIENYTGIIIEYIAERKDQKGSESKLKFPLSSPKVKRIGADEQDHDFEVISGCHTLKAAIKAELESIEVEICEGSDEDLLIEAIQDNAKHGLQYNREDIRHNILNLKKTSPDMTVREIAEIVGCSKSTVSNVLSEKKPDEHGKEKRKPQSYDRKQFVAGLLRMVEKNIDEYTDVDMIELAKLSGHVIKKLEEKRPELRDIYHESLQAILAPETAELIDYEGDTLYDEEKRKEIAALQHPEMKSAKQLKDAG